MKKKKEEPRVYVITTYKSVMPVGGTAAERDSIMSEWGKSILKKNNKILSSKTLVHYYGSDSRDWVVINEYKSLGDIEAAEKISQKLLKKKWPNAKKRKAIFRKLDKYFPDYEHSDEIYMAMPKFGK